MHEDRNERICDLYLEGWTHRAIAEQFDLSIVRIGQILKDANMKKIDRSQRDKAYIGTHVRSAVKDAIKKEGGSMSAFVAAAIEEKLEREGVPIPEEVSSEIDVPLPLEG